jgi:ribosomal protein S18 acetylase RimI-like enzyme
MAGTNQQPQQNPQNNASPVLRPVTASDDAQLKALYALSLRHNTEGFIQNPDHHGSIADRARAYQSSNGEMLGLFTADGTLIGMGGLKQKDAMRVELCNLHLHPDYQGQGLGKRMAAALMEDARELGYETIELHVTITQKAALGLYKKLGFVETKRQVFDVDRQSFDTVFMELAL